MKVLLLTPPMTQLNTPYPATAYLTGFFRKYGVDAVQSDPSIDLVLKLYSKQGLIDLFNILDKKYQSKRMKRSSSVLFFLDHAERYQKVIEPVIRFLQGKDPSLAFRIVSREFLPEGARFCGLQQGLSTESDDLGWAFGTLGLQDRAKYLASLMMDDLADVWREGVDSRFGLSRYGEKLAASSPTFDALEEALTEEPTYIVEALYALTDRLVQQHQPQVVGLTVPFPGNVYGALHIAKRLKKVSPSIRIVLGGGYVNTELRQLTDGRIFDYIDFILFDDGERPFLSLLEYLRGERPKNQLVRTFLREDGQVKWIHFNGLHDIPQRDTGTPTYDGLALDRYLSIFEMLNPMHRIWSDGRWNKLTLAHGCYWKKCNFCDVSLDYIGRYDPASADILVDRIISLMNETGQRGFHFVDEAAPPAVLRALAQRLLERQVVITWWGNIRFEKTFTPELVHLLAESGCIAVSGGLEVASDRLLKLMNKGVTVDQVARVTHAFTESGVMVHAYLMYGFPSQTEQETIDALERVRQLFQMGCIQSAFWHRFSVTAHSPIGLNPSAFGIRLLPESTTKFARNDLEFEDSVVCNHDQLGEGLRKALYNYMHGVGLDLDVRVWFGQSGRKFKVPRSTVDPDLIQSALKLKVHL